MLTYSENIKRVEPNTRICTTERITCELSRCTCNDNACKYGFDASKSTTYCLHPDHMKFLMLAN